MAKDFRFLTTRPAAGWTAATIATPQPSVTGPVNAMAQNNVTAADLRTTPSTLADSTLGSRRYMNPNTGIRDVAVSGSVYAQPDVPAFLSQAVSNLNAEQALRRSLQAEWNDKLLMGAMGQVSGSDPYLWMEALRAASVGPGSSVSFGQAIQDPNQGRAAVTNANANARLSSMKANILHQAMGNAYNQTHEPSPFSEHSASWVPVSRAPQRAADDAWRLQQQASFLRPIATAAAGGGSGWYSNAGSGWGGGGGWM